jgi:glycosyltransferase involved in cell wall biosynthesis
MKKIFLIREGNIASIPPVLAILDSLIGEYEIVVITPEYNDEIDNEYINKGVQFVHFYNLSKSRKFIDRVINKIKKYSFKYRAIKFLKKNKADLYWILSDYTAIQLKKILRDKNYILSLYELRDRKPKILNKVKNIAQDACKVVVPEYNRANILRVWLKLKETPTVLPNKPLTHGRVRVKSKIINDLSDKKVILYQGHISRDRNLNAICEAISTMNEYQLVLMGDGGEYIDELLKNYPLVKYINFIRPPLHLDITSNAYIGIVTYDYYSLNTIFCAPNKIWEYSGFSIPMIANSIPGLKYTVGKYNSGLCIDTNNVNEIKKAVDEINKHYEFYSNNAKLMFDDYSVKENIISIVKSCNIK